MAKSIDISLFYCYTKFRKLDEMSTKIAILKTGETLISDIKELVSDDKVCGYLFTKPFKIDVSKSILLTEDCDVSASADLQVSMTPWILLSNDEQIPVSLDWVVTVVEPIKAIIEMYEERVNGKNSKVSSS